MPNIFEQVKKQMEQGTPAAGLMPTPEIRKKTIFDQALGQSPEFQYKYVPPPKWMTEPSLMGYYHYLHTPTKPPKSIMDFLNRVIPESISKTTVGVVEFPFRAMKEIVTDPSERFVYDLLEGKEFAEASKNFGITMGEAALGMGKGLVDFFSGPLGLYMVNGLIGGKKEFDKGWNEFKKRWTTDPAGSALAIAPVVKGLRALPPELKIAKDVTRFGEKPKEIIQRIYHKIDRQAPFNAVGLEKTGVAVKTYPQVRIAERARVYSVLKESRKLKLTPEEGRTVTIKANLKEPGEMSPRIAKAVKLTREFLDEAAKRAKEDKALRSEFPKSQIMRNEAKIAEYRELVEKKKKTTRKPSEALEVILEEKLPPIEGEVPFLAEPKRAELLKKIEYLERTNELLKEVQYMPIPLDMWFGKLFDTVGPDVARSMINSGFTKRFFKGRFFRQRKTIDIADMIDWLDEMRDPFTGKKIYSNLDFDFRMLLAAYADKMGSIRGMAKIFNNAYAEGAIIPMKGDPPVGYGVAPLELKIKFPELRDNYIHNAFAEFMIQDFAKLDRSMKLGRIMGYTKIMAFWNPFFLPGYDIWQMSWYTSPLDYPKMPKYFAKGIKSFVQRDVEFYKASEGGAFSTPFTPPFENFRRTVEAKIEFKTMKRVFNRLKEYHKIYPMIDDMYKVIWNTAWGGDHIIRLSGYHYLREKGLSPLRAAQEAGYFHGDYARLSPTSRLIFNKILFTPTFKYAMGHVQANMIKSAIHVISNATKLKMPAQRDAMLARGLVMLYAGELGKDLLMKQWGFETDTLGLRYVKNVETDEGLKELVVYWPDPNNALLRQFYKWTNWPQDPDQLQAFMNKAKWDLHPLWQLSYEIIKNKKPDLTMVYNIFDSDGTGPLPSPQIAWDIIHHSISRIIAAEGALENIIAEKGPKAGYAIMAKDIGKVRTYLLSAVTLNYLRDGKDIRRLRATRELNRLFKTQFREEPPEDDKTAQRRLDNFFIRLNKINEDLEKEGIVKKEKPKGWFEGIQDLQEIQRERERQRIETFQEQKQIQQKEKQSVFTMPTP